MIGKSILHYRITDKLGAGGMGEVYLAYDERLDREVALKFLPAHVQSDATARERFLREARAASKLSHPNIVGLHYIEHADEGDFIVMEYVRGRSLRTVITEDRLTLPRTLAIAGEVAAALAAAHARGIVHRDIKAENIVLTEEGRAKVLDFGLAKVEGATQITDSTSTVGTVAYMSPEQTRGEDVDARTDLFSLGVLLYEMIAGCQPFRGEHRAAIIYSIVNETPEPLARYKADVPDELQRIVDKALRKDRETRYQSAADMAADIAALQNVLSTATTTARTSAVSGARETPSAHAARRPVWVRWTGIVFVVFLVAALGFFVSRWFAGGGTPGDTSSPPSATAPPVEEPQRIMIAVLPFENLGKAEDEYFADGITEEITARLARIEELGVIARTSVLRYKNTELPIEAIGEELGVDYVLEGTVRWQRADGGQSRVRVTPQLIRVTDATHVWADVFDRPLTAVFEVQSGIAGRVIDELNLTLVGPDELEAEPPTSNMDAYDAFLRGGNFFYDFSDIATGHRAAEKEFLRAVELDPEFAEAHASLSVVYSDLHWFGVRSKALCEQSREYAERALALDPDVAVTHVAMGLYYYHCMLDYDRALAQLKTALRIKPNDAETIAAIGYVHRRMGDWDAAVEELKKAIRLDPRFHHHYYELGLTLGALRRLDEAQWYLDKAIELKPIFETFIWRTILELMRGDVAAARRVLESCPDAPEAGEASMGSWIDVCSRDFEGALDRLLSARYEVDDLHFHYMPRALAIAEVCRLMGDTGRARVYADSALARIDGEISPHPDDSRLYSARGRALALLGKKREALESARTAAEMMPVSKESMQGPWRLRELVIVLIVTGEYDEAVEKLEYLMGIPAGLVTPEYLRIDPLFDPLRDHPRFRELVASQ